MAAERGNSRNGKRSKAVPTNLGPVEITVPRDREGSFEPKIVKKWQERLPGVDEMVISLAAKGLTPGEVQDHIVAGVYAAGNVTSVTETVIGSAAAGLKTVAALNLDLITEDTQRAIAARAVPDVPRRAPASGKDRRPGGDDEPARETDGLPQDVAS